MMKRIMPPRAAAVAFAASALVASPALADSVNGHKQGSVDVSTVLQLDLGDGLSFTVASGDWAQSHSGRYGHNRHYGHRGYGHRDYGYRGYGYQNRYQLRQLRREAVRACERAVAHEGWRLGFRDIDLDDVERVRQIGPRGFVVRAEFEFEGRRRDFERDVTCTVRQGRVVDIDNLPQTYGHGRGYGYGHGNGYGNYGDRDYRDRDYRDGDYRDRDWNDRDYRPRNNDYLKGGTKKSS